MEQEFNLFLESIQEGNPEWIDASDSKMMTPLHLAVLYDHKAMVKLLLRFGSKSLETPEMFGATPIVIAVMNDRTSIIRILRAIGASTIRAESICDFDQFPEDAELFQPLDDDYILKIRFSIYFNRSLLSTLLNLIE